MIEYLIKTRSHFTRKAGESVFHRHSCHSERSEESLRSFTSFRMTAGEILLAERMGDRMARADIRGPCLDLRRAHLVHLGKARREIGAENIRAHLGGVGRNLVGKAGAQVVEGD